jgi:DNA primase
MAYRGYRTGHRDSVSEIYTPEQIEATLNAIGVEVAGETGNDFLCFCPYHGNKFTPSFSVSRTSGAFICFNHACGETGNLVDLVRATTQSNYYEALRMLEEFKVEGRVSLKERRERRAAKEIPNFPQDALDKMKRDFWNDSPALAYMRERSFLDKTLDEYGIGYSAQKNLVATPMHDIDGNPVGVIGRTIGKDKAFKNSVGLPTSQSLWNIHRARRTGDTVIICEANFDAMRISQAGYPNVVACLGGNFSPYHADQLAWNFTNIIVMTDNDDAEKYRYIGCKKCKANGLNVCRGHNPGRALGESIAYEMAQRGKVVRWAAYEEGVVYPHDAKDAGDMTDEEIRQCLKNTVSNFTYKSWKIPS